MYIHNFFFATASYHFIFLNFQVFSPDGAGV